MSSWKPVMTVVHQGSIQGPIFVNMFINNIGSGTEWVVNKFVNDTKLRLEENVSVQRDLGRFENWSHVKLSNYNKAKTGREMV